MAEIKLKKKILTYNGNVVCERFSILKGIDISTNNAFVMLKFMNFCGELTEETMSVSDYENPKILLKNLKNKGFTFTQDVKANTALVDWLSAYEFKKVYLLISQTGWYKKGDKYAYVLPNKIYGKDLNVRFLSTKHFAKKIKTEGN